MDLIPLCYILKVYVREKLHKVRTWQYKRIWSYIYVDHSFIINYNYLSAMNARMRMRMRDFG